MKILLAIEYRNNAGNVHAASNYVRVGAELGHQIAIFGPPQPQVVDGWYLPPAQQSARFSTDVRAFDRVIFCFESKLRFLKRLEEVSILGTIPRRQRYVFDADARFNPFIVVDGYDRSHLDKAERAKWLEFYDGLSDRVIKPTFKPSDHPRVTAIPFFGFNPDLVIDPARAPPKKYDIMYLGHNWWRWKEFSEHLFPAFEQIRDQVGEIACVGMWWDAVPEWAEPMGLEPAFRVETETMRRLRIHAVPPVSFGDVIPTLSTSRINIFTQRPFLEHVRHLTLRYFEEFCADTIPLLMLEDDIVEAVYGPAGRELMLRGRVAEKILDALQRPDYYRGIVEDVRRHLVAHHSFRRRVEELVAALSD